MWWTGKAFPRTDRSPVMIPHNSGRLSRRGGRSREVARADPVTRRPPVLVPGRVQGGAVVEHPDDEPVLGVSLGGESRAYPLAILVWHFYFVIFDPAVYPMDLAWLTGDSPPTRVLERRPAPSALGPGEAP